MVATIAALDLPHGQWNDLITLLLNNVTSNPSNVNLKRASLETIGFICEEIVSSFLFFFFLLYLLLFFLPFLIIIIFFFFFLKSLVFQGPQHFVRASQSNPHRCRVWSSQRSGKVCFSSPFSSLIWLANIILFLFSLLLFFVCIKVRCARLPCPPCTTLLSSFVRTSTMRVRGTTSCRLSVRLLSVLPPLFKWQPLRHWWKSCLFTTITCSRTWRGPCLL